MNCRAKFYVEQVTEFGSADGNRSGIREIRLRAMYDDGLSAENKSFCDNTPSGDIKFMLANSKLDDEFRPGDIYYVDFTKAKV